MSDAPSIAEQVQVLLSCEDVATWSLQLLGLPMEWRDTNEPGNTERCQQAVDQCFTLTRRDLEDSLAAQRRVPESLPFVRTRADSRDGWYFLPHGRDWEFFYQERGGAMAGELFDDLAEARKLLINHLIPIWLEHLWVPCRTKGGKRIEQV